MKQILTHSENLEDKKLSENAYKKLLDYSVVLASRNFFVRMLKTIIFIRVRSRRFFYKKIFRPLLFTSRLGRKVLLGHVGKGLFVDYIYEKKPSGYTWFGQFIDRIILYLPAARATQCKFEKLSELLQSEISRNLKDSKTTRVVDLGSGPARYLVRMARKEKYQKDVLQALCLDIDRTSLRRGKQVGQGLPIEYRIGNVTQLGLYRRLAEKSNWRPNLVIVSTCYDFLKDSTTRKSLEELYHDLELGGAAIVVSQIQNPSERFLSDIRFPGCRSKRVTYYREPFIVKKWMQESGYKEIVTDPDKWGMYCFYIGRKTGYGSTNGSSDVPIFLKGRMYKRVINMRSNDAYQYMRGFKPLCNGKGLRGSRTVILMATNDYLGLRIHPRVVEAGINAMKKYGVSTASSRILAGNIELHEELQSKLAEFLNFEDVLVFSSGYTANLGVMATMLGNGEIALVDRYAHASLLDGCKLSGGITRFFAHNSIENLEKLLEEHRDTKCKLIVCDGIYSMDGDLAPLPDIFRLANQYNAGIVVDDGHATGIFGEKGTGTLEHFNIRNKERCLLLGSLGKGLGSTGGFAAGNRDVIDYLRHTTRSLLFSTGLPPVCAAATIAALEIIREQPERIQRLWSNTRKMRQGLIDLGYNIGTSISPLIPIIIGDEYTVYKMSAALEEAGVVIDGVAPPAVKQNQCRLRIRMMATHTERDIATVLQLLKKTGKGFGVI